MLVTISAAMGGLGLFLLGMWLMTEGLRNAAGTLLHKILHHWTKNRIRGLSAGFLLTALVQSSSAVTVATIGFTDAGLLKLKRAVWVIFGSNVGTTVTGWLVALIGFNFKISAFALPIIGIGMLLKLINEDKRLAHVGMALVGFGVLFLGIDVLKETFSGLDAHITLAQEHDAGFIDILFYTGAGFILTALMQSSAITLVITLTALAGGMITLIPAAALVIGSNLGTTTTAVMSALGAGSAAKRVVASHVLFNLITACVSLLILAPLLHLIEWIQQLFYTAPNATTTLALFHTSFNIIGVMLMWPLASPLVNWLSHRFVTIEEDDSKTLYLRKQALSVQSLAMHALKKELQRLSDYVLLMAKDSLNFEATSGKFSGRLQAVKNRLFDIGHYSTLIYQQHLSEKTATDLPVILRITRYYDAIAELATQINQQKPQLNELAADIQQALNTYCKNSIHLFNTTCINTQDKIDSELLALQINTLENDYQALKSLLLRRGTEGSLSISRMEKSMVLISQIRRINQQTVKAFEHFSTLVFAEESEGNNSENSVEDKVETSPV